MKSRKLNDREVKKQRFINFWETILCLLAIIAIFSTLSYFIFGGPGMWISLAVILITFFSGKSQVALFALKVYNAQYIHPFQAPELYEIVMDLSNTAHLLNPPKLYYMIDTKFINAFSTGSKDDSHIVLSDTILSQLNERELTAVIAHEMAHIIHGDLNIMTVTQLMGRFMAILSQGVQVLIFILVPFILTGLVVIPWTFFFIITIAPMLYLYLQMRLSRAREFAADLASVELTNDPEALALALKKMGYFFESRLGFLRVFRHKNEGPNWLKTHPDTEQRILRLMQIKKNKF